MAALSFSAEPIANGFVVKAALNKAGSCWAITRHAPGFEGVVNLLQRLNTLADRNEYPAGDPWSELR